MGLNCVGAIISGFFPINIQLALRIPGFCICRFKQPRWKTVFCGGFFQPSYGGLSHVPKGGAQSSVVWMLGPTVYNILFYKRELSICGFGYLCVNPVTNPPWNSKVICGFFTVWGVSTPNSCIVQRSTVVGIKKQSLEQQQSLSALGNRLCFLPYSCIQPLCTMGCVMTF